MKFRSLIAVALTTLAACERSRLSERAPGEPTMNELMHGSASARTMTDQIPAPRRDPSPGELRGAERANAPAEVYARAIRHYTADDKPRALEVLDRAGRAYSSDERLALLRARLCCQVLAGSRGALPYGVVHTVSGEDAKGKLAREIRRRLDTSSDARLLLQVARELVGLRLPPPMAGKLDFDPLALAQLYVEKARRAGGEELAVSGVSSRIERARTYNEMGRLLRGRRPEQALAEATPAQKLMLLELIMNSSGYRDERGKAAEAANALLQLTDNSPKTPRTLEIRANAQLMLGKIALRNGDPRTAIRQMFASVAEPSPHQRHSFELARALVDWGYREDVARYLDLAARGRRDSQKLSEWAALIRRGRNPDLTPYQTGCGKEPC